VQAAAVTAALVSAGFLIWMERRLPALQEAVIGVVFVVAASAEILLLSYNPHGAENLKDLLVGQILWVVPADLIPVAILYAVILAFVLFVDLAKRRVLFYALFALAVTASVQLVGVFLVFATLIIPALVARGLGVKHPVPFAYGLGLLGYLLGLLSSALLDLPTGAAIVCALALLAALSAIAGAVRVQMRA
jgi:zinc/manganese transport system permease protein